MHLNLKTLSTTAVVLSLLICFSIIVFYFIQSTHEVERYDNEDKLLFAHVLFRNGNRTVTKFYETDPYKDPIYWPEGVGGLTNIGKQKSFELGRYLRRRYEELLAPDFSPNHVYIRSAESPRMFKSAEYVTAGLLLPSEQRSWSISEENQLIPIHSVPIDEDYLLFGIPCERADKDQIEYFESEEIQAFLNKCTVLRQYLEKHTGVSVKTVLELPFWAEEVLRTSNDVLEFDRVLSFISTAPTTESRKARCGFLLKEILDRFKNKTMGLRGANPSLWLYSSHEVTIVSVLNALGIFKYRIASFASSVHFELYQHGSEYYVQIFFRDDNSEYVPPVEIPNCGTKCPLDKLYELYKDVIPTENETYESVCSLSK